MTTKPKLRGWFALHLDLQVYGKGQKQEQIEIFYLSSPVIPQTIFSRILMYLYTSCTNQTKWIKTQMLRNPKKNKWSRDDGLRFNLSVGERPVFLLSVTTMWGRNVCCVITDEIDLLTLQRRKTDDGIETHGVKKGRLSEGGSMAVLQKEWGMEEGGCSHG